MNLQIDIFGLSLILILLSGCQNYKYLGQRPPGDTPIIFAPDVVSLPNRKEEVITFSPDLREVYFSVEYYPEPKPSFTLFMEFENGKWSVPDTVSYSKSRRTSEPFMALDGSRIYYFADNVHDQKGLLDICYSNRIQDGWSEPISLGVPPNFSKPYFTLHPCITSDTTIYFSSHSGEVCRSEYSNGIYLKPEILPEPINHMNQVDAECWGDPYVTQDDQVMIFRSNRTGGYGGTDLYIVFKKMDGTWSIPQNLGPKINSKEDELGGDITPDGKYLTFGRSGDIYWVSTDFLKDLRASRNY